MSETYRDENCLEHMIEACRKIRRIADVSRTDYESSEEKQLALERLFEIVGEAASKVSEDFKKTHPQLPWREATAMRNFVVHDYAGVDIDVIWDSAQTDIPKLLLELEAINLR